MTGQNTVDVDETQIRRELEDLGAPPAENLQPGNADLQPGAADPPASPPPAPAMAIDWTIASVGIVNLFAGVAENWQLTDDEKRSLVEPLNQVFVAFFPDLHLDPRWQALGVLAISVGSIAYARMENGKLRPLRKPKPSRDPGAQDAEIVHGTRAPS